MQTKFGKLALCGSERFICRCICSRRIKLNGNKLMNLFNMNLNETVKEMDIAKK